MTKLASKVRDKFRFEWGLVMNFAGKFKLWQETVKQRALYYDDVSDL